jgi:tetratricopeptide (TPR) repeat protein
VKAILRILFVVIMLGGAACSKPPSTTVSDPDSPIVEEISYSVREGDSWGRVSEAFFGDSSRGERIAQDNSFHPAIDPVPLVDVTIRIREDELSMVRAIAEARGSYNAGVEAMQREGGDQAAAAAFERAVDRAPHFVDARYNLGLVQMRLGDPSTARKNLEVVVEARPGDAEAWYALAAASFHAGDYGAALGPLERSLELDPVLLRARWTHALCLQRMGRGAEAITAWRRYLELDSTSAWADQARQNLAELGA